nr:hypothetical protein Iba_chr09cCG3050 [Ipomoea batatas]
MACSITKTLFIHMTLGVSEYKQGHSRLRFYKRIDEWKFGVNGTSRSTSPFLWISGPPQIFVVGSVVLCVLSSPKQWKVTDFLIGRPQKLWEQTLILGISGNVGRKCKVSQLFDIQAFKDFTRPSFFHSSGLHLFKQLSITLPNALAIELLEHSLMIAQPRRLQWKLHIVRAPSLIGS